MANPWYGHPDPAGLEVNHEAFPHPNSSSYYTQSSSANVPELKETAPHYEENVQTPSRSRWRGRTFWGILILIIVIIGAAVGGGVGGAIAVQNAKSKANSDSDAQDQATITVTIPTTPTGTALSLSRSATTTASSTTLYTPPAPTSVEKVDISCPGSSFESWKGDSFDCYEETQIDIGSQLGGMVAYTLQACVDACSTMNAAAQGETKCVAVSMEWDLSYAYEAYSGANCYLRGVTGPTSDNVNVTSAVLSTS